MADVKKDALADAIDKEMAPHAKPQVSEQDNESSAAKTATTASLPNVDRSSPLQHPLPEHKYSLVDAQHVYGNFRNYYTFNAVSKRVELLNESAWRLLTSAVASPSSLPSVSQTSDAAELEPFGYLDVGCNEGELTIAMHEELVNMLTSSGRKVRSVGVDLDAVLIERAKLAVKQSPSLTQEHVAFDAVDVMNRSSVSQCEAITSYIGATTTQTTTTDAVAGSATGTVEATNEELGSVCHPRRFSLVSCFSITMWIHLNNGDEGLNRFLEAVSALADVLLIEPQPWKCYRSARKRMNKKGMREQTNASKEGMAITQDQVIPHIRQFLLGPRCGFKTCTQVASTHWERPLLILTR